jgi:DNA modification methylase/superfamily II DNA or RNA helicase
MQPQSTTFTSPDDYATFLAQKRLVVPACGRDVPADELHPALFPFQRVLVRWSLRKGRAALFADTGLGKTLMQLVWAQHAAERVLILAPLAVAQQTVAEGARFGIDVTYARKQSDAALTGITITNYEMLGHFDAATFGAVVLDESSILKSFEGKVRSALISTFAATPFRLCCTATPAPNDVAELANHAEFLGVLSRTEMLARFFVFEQLPHGQGTRWRLKGHAHDPFYRWLASWAMSVKHPSDLGYSDDGFVLPPLQIEPCIVPTEYTPPGQLFATRLHGIQERSQVRRSTLMDRVNAAVGLITAEPEESWLVWCGLNDEGRELARRLSGALLVEGADSPEVKATALTAFARGAARILITKVTIAGFGMNFQHCARMAFVGLSDSYEQYYQAIRRCWRFGQARSVRAYVVLSEPEEPVYRNVLNKEQEADRMNQELIGHVAAFERAEIAGDVDGDPSYETGEYHGTGWQLLVGDSAERLAELAEASVDFTLFSPPFATLYTYSPTPRDLGNSASREEFLEHFGFITRQLLRVCKPGRLVGLHVQQEIIQKQKSGYIGVHDLRGDFIRHFEAYGWIYHGEICIDKNPQAQAIRTKSKGLLFVQLRKDASWLRPALADYVLLFRKPGENAVPIQPALTNDEWIEWAHPIWYGIRESDTLNVQQARSERDERHICPLQLGTIERCIRLWSNRGETILSPFAGIGSEGVVAMRHGRRFVGVELKPQYAAVAARNLAEAVRQTTAPTLFDGLEMESF